MFNAIAYCIGLWAGAAMVRSHQIFPIKGHIVNIFSLMGYRGVATTTQQLCYSLKAATGSTQTNEHDCIPIDLYYKNR